MASISLYRKYRPQNFKDVVGQNHIKTTLINSLVGNRISHAYLFTGPRGVGKTTIARILAKAVNCQNLRNGEPCNNCSNCKEINEEKSLDLIEIDGASNRGIDEIRELREKIKFTPHKAKYKIFIIDEVHMLTKEAFNALLKTLEEPPPHAIFILATTEVHKIPQTVISRCQRFNFSRIPLPLIIEELERISKEEKIKTSKEALRMIASYSEGSLRDAESILDQVASFGKKNVTEEVVKNILGMADMKITNNLLWAIISGNQEKSLEIINKATEEGIDITILIDTLIEKSRDLLFIKMENFDALVKYEKSELEKLKELSKKIEISRIIEVIENLTEAKQKVKFSVPNHLPLELVVLKLGKDNYKKSDKDLEKEEEKNANSKIKIFKKSSKKSSFKNQETIPDLLEIKNNWKKIQDELKLYNHSLAICIKTANPERIENKTLVLSFEYSFHKDKIQNITNKRIVEDIIKKVTGKFIPIRCFVKPKNKKEEKSILEDAADILGGEII